MGVLAVLLYMGTDMPLYAFSLFLPSIINQVSTIQFLLNILDCEPMTK